MAEDLARLSLRDYWRRAGSITTVEGRSVDLTREGFKVVVEGKDAPATERLAHAVLEFLNNRE